VIKRKQSMTSFDVAAVVSELKRLRGSRLVNIYDYGSKGILLRFKGAKDALVVAVPAVRVHITRYEPVEKHMPSSFVMGLRKYIRDAKLEEVEQHRFDRILILTLKRGSDTYKLIVELLPRGVIALLDENNTILQINEEREMKDRILKRGVKYKFPPSLSIHPSSLNVETFKKLVEASEGEAVRVLTYKLGIPGEVAEEILARLDIPINVKITDMLAFAESFVDEIKRIYHECVSAKGYLIYSDSNPITATCFEPWGLVKRYKFRIKELESISQALDEYFAASSEAKPAGLEELEAEKAKLKASLESALSNLKRLEEKVRELEEEAAFIAEHLPELYEVYECAVKLRERSGWDSIVGGCPRVVEVEPKQGKVKVSINDKIVEIDIRTPPDKLVVELYKRIGELKAKIERGRQAIAEAEAKLKELEEKIKARIVRAKAQVRRREWYEKYHWLITSGGYLAIGGRDASQNESIVKKYLNDKRIFMHADIHGAPAVVIFSEGETPSPQDLREAAILAAAYSKAWKAGMGSVDVYWVWGSQVSKSPPSGEYLAKGAFMVYGKKNYVGPIELKLAIGIGLEDGKPIVIVGPDYLVKRRSVVYAVLVPGDEDPSQIAKKLRKLLAEKAGKELRPIIEAVTVEELRMRIPGRARIIYVGRGEAKENPRPVRVLHGEEGSEA
jgi:predicted ribosome quality control (RQC) complex YloA/Tae2 family protein